MTYYNRVFKLRNSSLRSNWLIWTRTKSSISQRRTKCQPCRKSRKCPTSWKWKKKSPSKICSKIITKISLDFSSSIDHLLSKSISPPYPPSPIRTFIILIIIFYTLSIFICPKNNKARRSGKVSATTSPTLKNKPKPPPPE